MRPARRPAVLAVALAATVSLLVGLGVVVGGLGSALATTERATSVVHERAERIEIEVGSGDVTVMAGPARRGIRIKRTSRSFLAGPKVTQEVRGGVLRLHSDCPLPLPGPCRTSYELHVPRGVAVTASSTAGNVRVQGVDGAVRAESTAGNVEVGGGGSRVVDAHSTAGNVAVALRERPDRVDAGSTAGNVDVQVPRGRYSVEAATSAGDRSITGLIDDPGARRTVSARTTAGNADVRAG